MEDTPNPDVVQIDACPMCNGAWFDEGELDVVDGRDDQNVEKLVSEESKASDRPCPRGHGLMREHTFPGELRTPVERCATCGGLWLDGEERRKLARATTKEGQETTAETWAKRGAIWAVQMITQLPVEVENPKRGTPWIVIGLLAILLAMFGLQYLHWVDTGDCLVQARRRGHDPGICLAPVAGRLREQLHDMGVSAISKGSWYTIFTHMFLHGNWAHLLGNIYFLWIFGDNVEEVFGRRRFIALFLLAGLVGGLLEVLLTQATADPIVGASGGIAGVMAAYLWCFPRNKLFQVILFVQVKLPAWVYIFFWIGFQFVMGLFATNSHVAWFSHIGGFMAGIIMTPLVLRARRSEVAAKVKVPATNWIGRGTPGG